MAISTFLDVGIFGRDGMTFLAKAGSVADGYG
jgi:hypothetical protein